MGLNENKVESLCSVIMIQIREVSVKEGPDGGWFDGEEDERDVAAIHGMKVKGPNLI